MILTFLAPSTPRPPSGGTTVIYGLANAMAQRGHEVYLFDGNFFGMDAPTRRRAWHYQNRTAREFAVEGSGDDAAPDADFFFGYRAEPELPSRIGLPVSLVQGYKMLDEKMERRAYHVPCPKVCVAEWLVDVGRDLGVPPRQLAHVPPGLHHDQYRIVAPIPGRPPQISFCYSPHRQKGAPLALAVLAELKRSVPEVEAVVFGARAPKQDLPRWVTYRTSPSRDDLIHEIYNKSRVFLMPSQVEGFGLPAVEAMACGAALVTTDNGGSRDYAFHDQTALVAPYGDLDALSGYVSELLEDDDRRIALATAGREYVQRFNWDHSAELLEAFLERYLDEPFAYGDAARRA